MEFSTNPNSDSLQFSSSLNADSLLNPIDDRNLPSSTSITFIDSSISDYETLIAGMEDTQIHILNSEQDAYQDVLASFTVDSTIDVVDSNDGVTTLREAINSANAIAGFDSIVFDSSLFSSEQTIGLNLGQLNITDSLSINAPANLVTVSGNETSRVFEIAEGTTVNLSRLIIADGKVTGDNGGGIKSSGNLTLENTIVRNNSVEDGNGGGIYNTGENFTVINSAISDNQADQGGGIYNTGDNLTINNSSINNNETSRGFGIKNGGGIYNTGRNLTVSDSSITNNQGSDGGGIYSNPK